jgi:hypothetical protein
MDKIKQLIKKAVKAQSKADILRQGIAQKAMDYVESGLEDSITCEYIASDGLVICFEAPDEGSLAPRTVPVDVYFREARKHESFTKDDFDRYSI